MKKKNKILLSACSTVATVGLACPLLTTLTSCGHKSGKFDGDDVKDGTYTPDWDPTLEWKEDKINLIDGNRIYLEKLAANKGVAADEYKWTAAGGAWLLQKVAEYANKALDQNVITISKYNARMSDFKINQYDGNDKMVVSYKVAQDIEIDLNYSMYSAKAINAPFEQLGGKIRLAWCNTVKNMPLALFDIGTDNWKEFSAIFGHNQSNDDPFDSFKLWYLAPDMSQVGYADKSWNINFDCLIDANISVDSKNIINDTNELVFDFDYQTAGEIEALLLQYPNYTILANLVERLIPLLAGWNSYYLSQTTHYDHITSETDDSGWQTDTVGGSFIDPMFGELTAAATNPLVEATMRYKLAEENIYKTSNDITALTIGLDLSGNKKIPFTIPKMIRTTVDTYKSGKYIDVKYDWRDSRPKLDYDTYTDENLLLLPIVMTKDWISFGKPFSLYEGSVLKDSYHIDNGLELNETYEMSLFGRSDDPYDDKSYHDLSFHVTRALGEWIKKNPNKVNWQLYNESQEYTGITVDKCGDCIVDLTDSDAILHFPMKAIARRPQPDAYSQSFRINFEYQNQYGDWLSTQTGVFRYRMGTVIELKSEDNVVLTCDADIGDEPKTETFSDFFNIPSYTAGDKLTAAFYDGRNLIKGLSAEIKPQANNTFDLETTVTKEALTLFNLREQYLPGSIYPQLVVTLTRDGVSQDVQFWGNFRFDYKFITNSNKVRWTGDSRLIEVPLNPDLPARVEINKALEIYDVTDADLTAGACDFEIHAKNYVRNLKSDRGLVESRININNGTATVDLIFDFTNYLTTLNTVSGEEFDVIIAFKNKNGLINYDAIWESQLSFKPDIQFEYLRWTDAGRSIIEEQGVRFNGESMFRQAIDTPYQSEKMIDTYYSMYLDNQQVKFINPNTGTTPSWISTKTKGSIIEYNQSAYSGDGSKKYLYNLNIPWNLKDQGPTVPTPLNIVVNFTTEQGFSFTYTLYDLVVYPQNW